jgi:hypothetical protein
VSAAVIVPDVYDKLFLRCNGTTTTFVDSSTASPKTITANGNATQLAWPVAFAGKRGACFLNGTTDYGDIADSANFAFGVGAFEIEFYFNTGIAATAQTILDNRNATADTDAWLVNIINSTGNKLCFTTATTARITGTTTLAINTWYKAKLVGNGGANGARTVIMYLATADGNYAQEGSTYTADYNFAKEKLRIGAIKSAAGTYMNGWLKNIKLTKATTLALDMRFDTPATSPLAPAIAFDGTGDYLSLADSDDWDFGSNPFTVEWFENNSSFVNYASSICRDNETSYTPFIFGFNNGTGGAKTVQITSNGSSWDIANLKSLGTATVNRWHHYAVVRDGNTFYAFKDGVQTDTWSSASAIIGSTKSLSIGFLYSQPTFSGSMREIRISNVARYTTAFTPSQNGFTVDANTKLYIKGDENNGVGGTDSTDIKDSETTPKVVTCKGDAKIKYTEDYRSCIFKDETGKFPYPVGSAKVDFFAIGSGVGYFDGTNSSLTTLDSDDYFYGTNPFTFETYLRVPAAQSKALYYQGPSGVGNNQIAFSMVTTTLRMWVYTGGVGYAIDVTTPFAPTANTWYHISFVRVNSDNAETAWGIFINGIASPLTLAAGAWNGTLPNSSDSLSIGNGSDGFLNGLLDNIRISKGVARYTTTFNPDNDYAEPRTGRRKTNWFFFF